MSDGYVVKSCEILRDMGIAEAYPDAVTQWDICACFGVRDKMRRDYYDRLCEPGVASAFTPRRGAYEFLVWARTRGRVVALTSPLDSSPTWAYDREAWLVAKLGFSLKDVVSARDKSLVPGILVDDKPSHVDARKSSYLLDTTYNKGACPSQRVTSFDHLRHRLEAYDVFSQR